MTPYGNQATNTYSPYQGINPYGGSYTIQQTAQPSNANGGFMTILVESEEEVNNYPVAAGVTVLLVSFNLKKFWLKGTNTSGIPQPLRTFEFNETTPSAIQNDGNTVTRSEFDALSSKLDKLISELGGTKNE